MVRKQCEQAVTVNVKMRGGDGEIRLESLLSAEELYDKGRLFSRVVVAPGCSIGYHTHENEMEAYIIINGNGEYDDDGTRVRVEAGDVTLTRSGQGHGVVNDSGADLIMLALILHKDRG